MRVLAAIVVPPHLSASGGARAGRALSEALAGRCAMSIASMSDVDRTQPGAARRLAVRSWLPAFARALPRRYRSLFYRSDIPGLVEGEAWDLVHLHNPMPALEMARIASACVRAGIPYVVSTHGFNEVANGSAVYGFGALRRAAWAACMGRPVARTVRGAAAVFALSPADLGIVAGFGFRGPVRVVANGVELPPAPDPGRDRAVCERLGVAPAGTEPAGATGVGPGHGASALTCMFLGNHTPNKGVPVLLEAFAGLDCPYQLIVGGEQRPEIDYGRAGTGRADQRVVLTGRLSDEEVGALLRRADLFVFPTLADTFPLVVLEAMAQGCAVLASSVGGIPHQLDGRCGVLVPPGDVAALRAAVTRLAADRAGVAAMGQAGRARVAAAFTWQAAAEAAHEGYREVLGRPTGARDPAAPAVPVTGTSHVPGADHGARAQAARPDRAGLRIADAPAQAVEAARR